MPEGKFVGFGVVIASKKLPEYRIKNDLYTEVDLHGPNSYLLEEDGQDSANSLGQYAGTISVVCTTAIEKGLKRMPVFKTNKATQDWGTGQRLQHLTKKDVGHYKKGNLVSREGRVTFCLSHTNHYRCSTHYVPSDEVLEELVLNYRPYICSSIPAPSVTFDCHSVSLEGVKGEKSDIGPVVEDSQDVEKSLKVPEMHGHLITPENIKRRESSAPMLQQIKSEVGLIPSDNIKRRASETFQLIRAKEENQDDSIIIIGDSDEEDNLYDECEGDSVVYMGDDECCILELSNNFSIVELEESMLDDTNS
ncbi:hypothetical protein C0Q70_18873 [Pomacea canaliculata]|uniref:Uncharacterized protein n=1 Tax=Pomacea canaliculata TaxID=400727 RepID=A0A2T7NHR9_POMCA|nr:hypothetical protein C0Q70_18873 [Pomacea canaliculata]